MPIENLIAIRRLQGLMDMTDLMVGDDAMPSLLEAIARDSSRPSASRAW